jgi:hypothetical protein
VRLKKRIVRTLIEEVLVDVDGSAAELILTLHCAPSAAACPATATSSPH